MPLTDAQWVAAQVEINVRLIAGTITEAQAIAQLTAATEDWPTRTLSNADLALRVSRVLANLGGLIETDGPPSMDVGAPGATAFDRVNFAFYGPKTAESWGEPRSLVGPVGPAGVISGATIAMLAPGAEPTVTLGGTPSDRTVAFGIPAARDGTDGATPNVSAEVTMIAAGQPAVVTRSGPDSAPVFTFQLPRSADGEDGREVELQPGVTHLQWRYVGEPTWINLFARADFQGDPGEKGAAFEFDAKPADLAGRAAYDAEPEGFTVLVMDTGMVFARVGAAPGGWSDGFPFGQTQNAILTALSELSAAPGLLYQEDGSSFSKRAIGAASDTDVLDRQAGDERYRGKGEAVAMGDVSGLGDALDEKASAGAVLIALGDKEDKAAKGQANGYAGLDADGKVPAGQLRAMGAVESVAGLAGTITAWDLNGALGVRTDFGQQAISLSRLTGQIQGMARGVADDFQGTDGVDAAASTGEQYSAGTKSYSGVPGSPLPIMTEFNAPAGNEATASSEGNPASLPPWKVFDRLDNTIWLASSGALPQWLRRKIPAAAMVSSYTIQASDTGSGGNGPTAWTVRGSNNGTDWITIDTRTGIAWVSNKQVQTFTVQSPGSYLYYELNMTAASGAAALQVIEWTMTTAPSNMSLRSAAFAATASPSRATLMVRAKGSSALAPGVDIKSFVSRDGGTSWMEATLTAGITTGGFTTFEAANIDLSALPAGTAMKWRVDTLPTKAPEVDAVVLQWSPN